MTSGREEDLYWEGQVVALHHDSLKTVRETAAKWQATIGTVLGLFGSVAFLKGGDTFISIGLAAPWPMVLLAMIVVAVVLAFAATVLSALAAQGIPGVVRGITGEELEERTIAAAERSSQFLGWARVATLIAGIMVLVGASAVLTVAALRQQDPSIYALVKRANGDVLCGSLVRPSALQLRVKDAPDVMLRSEDSIALVPRCPE